MKVFLLVLVVAAVNAAPVVEKDKRDILGTLGGLLNGGGSNGVDLGSIVSGLGSLVGGGSGGDSGSNTLGNLVGLLGNLAGSGGGDSSGSDALGALTGLLGNLAGSGTGRPSGNSTASTGTGSSGTGGAGGALGNLAGLAGGGTIGAIGGLTDGLFNLGKQIITDGQNHPSNGNDIHHHAAEHGAQSAILKALQNGDFGK